MNTSSPYIIGELNRRVTLSESSDDALSDIEEEYEEFEDEFEDEFDDDIDDEFENELDVYKSSIFEFVTPKPYVALSPKASFYKKPHQIRCLGDIIFAQSSRVLTPFDRFPQINIDHDLTKHLWEASELAPFEDDVTRYKNLVKYYNAETVRDIIEQLGNRKMNLKYYGLTNRSYKILFEVLIHNKTIKSLDLTNNFLHSADVAEALADMLTKNKTIQEINLSFCDIGPELMTIICKGLNTNTTLKILNLSHCNIKDAGCKKLSKRLSINTGLRKLDISYNNLTKVCCTHLGDGLFDNNYLTEINLSGNHFKEGLTHIVDNLRDNFSQKLSRINLACCSISSDNEKAVRRLIRKVSGLKYIDLSRNECRGVLLSSIISGLERNERLHALKLAYNPMSPEDITNLLECVRNLDPTHPFRELDLTDRYIPKELQKTVEEIMKSGRHIIFRDYLCNFTIEGPDMKMMYIHRLKAMCESKKRTKGKKKTLFGSFFYNLKTKYCKIKEFREILKEFSECNALIRDKDFIKGIAREFTDETRFINLDMIREMYLQAYPETPQPKLPAGPVEQKVSTPVGAKAAKKSGKDIKRHASIEK